MVNTKMKPTEKLNTFEKFTSNHELKIKITLGSNSHVMKLKDDEYERLCNNYDRLLNEYSILAKAYEEMAKVLEKKI